MTVRLNSQSPSDNPDAMGEETKPAVIAVPVSFLLSFVSLNVYLFGLERALSSSILSRPTAIRIAVFGGSTSAGAGTSAPDEYAWPAVLQQTLLKNGYNCTVDNYARGATTADYYSTCFSRFLKNNYDVILLEFALTGGDVAGLVQRIKSVTNAEIVLVRQYSCRSVHANPAAEPGCDGAAKAQRRAAYLYRLEEIDFVQYVARRYGGPCSQGAQDALFDSREKGGVGKHHLGDMGSELLGLHVAQAVMQRMRGPVTRRGGARHWLGRGVLRRVPRVDRDYLLCSFNAKDSGIDEPRYLPISTALVAQGWEFGAGSAAQSFQRIREDKICWITNKRNATLTLPVLPHGVRTLTLFVERSWQNPGQLVVLCAQQSTAQGRLVGNLSLQWESKSSIVQPFVLNVTGCEKRVEFKKISGPMERELRLCGLALE